jgi:ankyrin repeat protein
LAVAQYLVHAGADINLKTKGGQTACDLANKNRKGTVVQMLSLYMKAQNEERERLEREAEEKRQRIKAIQVRAEATCQLRLR